MKPNIKNIQSKKLPNDSTERPALKPAAISNQNAKPVRSSDLVGRQLTESELSKIMSETIIQTVKSNLRPLK